MRPYEVMVIFDASLEEGDIREHVEKLVSLLKSKEAKTGKIDHMGRRTFAYELKHKTEGYYVLVEFLAEPTVVADVDRLLTLDDNVLRHKVMRVPEHAAGRNRARKAAAGRSHGRPEADSHIAASAVDTDVAASEPAAS
jgi:small subunit ribosomal protein S6